MDAPVRSPRLTPEQLARGVAEHDGYGVPLIVSRHAEFHAKW